MNIQRTILIFFFEFSLFNVFFSTPDKNKYGAGIFHYSFLYNTVSKHFSQYRLLFSNHIKNGFPSTCVIHGNIKFLGSFSSGI